MAKRNEPGLIRYTFGMQGEGAQGLLNPRVLLPAAAMLILSALLVYMVIDRPSASLKIAVSHTAAPRQLKDGRLGTFFNGWVNNRGQEEASYTLFAREKESAQDLVLKGQTSVTLGAGENRRLDFALVTEADTSLTVEFVLTDSEGEVIARTDAYLGKQRK